MDSGKKLDKPSIFPALLAPPEGIPAPSVEEIKDEALSVLAAAADTTGNAMTVAAYNVVNNPEIYRRLREELVVAFPNAEDELDYATLEKLPYLVCTNSAFCSRHTLTILTDWCRERRPTVSLPLLNSRLLLRHFSKYNTVYHLVFPVVSHESSQQEAQLSTVTSSLAG